MMNTLFLTDFYKTSHHDMYPQGTSLIYSNLTARKSRMSGVNYVVVFGVQYLLEKLKKDWHNGFFSRPLDEVVAEYDNLITTSIGVAPNVDHIVKLHKLGYLPIKIKSLAEGTRCPITDNGIKKSAKGLLKVDYDGASNIVLLQSVTKEEEATGLLQTVFENGEIVHRTTYSEIVNKLRS